jgi:3-polyprenyl-4-hydroxybenzoate decarboxylase
VLFEAGVQTVAVNVTPGGCCHWHIVASIRKAPGDGKNAIMALLSIADIKHVTIVDDDIDVFDPVDVEWAVATRVQADRDVVIISNARSKPLDPSLPLPVHGKVPTTAKMGIDATIPENIPAERYKRIVYFNQGKVDLKNYLGAAESGKAPAASAKTSAAPKPFEGIDELVIKVSAVLEKSHCFFADLLEKFPRADYKSIGSAVAKLYEEGKITQDSEGKFQPKTPESSSAV